MLKNELNLCKVLLDGNTNMIRFHRDALNSGYSKEPKFRSTAYRCIKVSKKNNKIVLKYIPGPLPSTDVVQNAYSLLYRNCPQDTGASRYYFGDLRIGLNKNGTSLPA
jgi:hypothetical protein